MTSIKVMVFFMLAYICLSASAIGLLEITYLDFGGTWGSDSFYYHETAERLSQRYREKNIDGRFYVYFHAFCLKIFNAAVFPSLLLFFVYSVLFIINVSRDDTLHWLYHFATIGNPIIFWTIARGLKEGLILVTLLGMYTIARQFQRSNFIYIFGPIMLFLFSFFMQGIRPLGFEFGILVATIAMMVWLKVNVLILLVFLLTMMPFMVDIIMSIFKGTFFIQRLQAQSAVFKSSIGVENLSESVSVSVFRFIFGPGPIKPILSKFSEGQFYEPTIAGIVLISLGSLIWWGFLFNITLVILKHRFRLLKLVKFSYFGNYFIIFAGLHILTYAVVYGGMVDTRHRALMYLLIYPIAQVFINVKRSNES